MSLDRDLATTGKASAPDLATVPARPQIEPREMSTGGPVVLERGAEASWKHALGWEDRSERRGGRCFIIVKATFTGSFRVIERFPMTDAGWRRAWKALVKLDRDGAAKALEALADRAGAAGRKADLARLTAQTIGVLADGRYIPGRASCRTSPAAAVLTSGSWPTGWCSCRRLPRRGCWPSSATRTW